MIDFETYHGIGNSISNRIVLAADLTRKLAEQDRQDTQLKERLFQKVPEELRLWIDQEAVLTNLFCHGKWDDKIYFNRYSFKGITDVRRKMKILEEAWKYVVFIRVSDSPDTNRVEVTLSAVM